MLNAIGMLATPLISGAIDLVGQSLNLDPKLTAAAKVAVGSFSLNPTLVVDGASQFVSELSQSLAARTEYHPARGPSGGLLSPGYAAPLASAGPVYVKDSPLPGDYGKYLESLKTLQANRSLFDGLVARDGAINQEELTRMAGNTKADARLRGASQFLLDNPHYLNRLDRAMRELLWAPWSLGLTLVGIHPTGGDGRITAFELGSEIRRVEADIRQYGLPESARPSTSSPPSTRETSSPDGTSSTRSSSSPGSSGSTGSKAPSAGSSEVKKILGDKNLSLEQKLERVLKLLTGRLNAQLADAMLDMEEAVEQQGSVKSGDKKAQLKADQEVQEIMRRLQDLQQQKQQLSQLMSTFSLKYHEMAQVALQNMAR